MSTAVSSSKFIDDVTTIIHSQATLASCRNNNKSVRFLGCEMQELKEHLHQKSSSWIVDRKKLKSTEESRPLKEKHVN